MIPFSCLPVNLRCIVLEKFTYQDAAIFERCCKSTQELYKQSNHKHPFPVDELNFKDGILSTREPKELSFRVFNVYIKRCLEMHGILKNGEEWNANRALQNISVSDNVLYDCYGLSISALQVEILIVESLAWNDDFDFSSLKKLFIERAGNFFNLDMYRIAIPEVSLAGVDLAPADIAEYVQGVLDGNYPLLKCFKAFRNRRGYSAEDMLHIMTFFQQGVCTLDKMPSGSYTHSFHVYRNAAKSRPFLDVSRCSNGWILIRKYKRRKKTEEPRRKEKNPLFCSIC